MMNPRRLNLILWSATALLFAACVVLGYLGVTGPMEPAQNLAATRTQNAATGRQNDGDNLPTLEALAGVGGLDLRQQLIKEAVVEEPQPEAPVPPAPRLDLRLTGTVIESDRPYAILDDTRGIARLVRVGDEVKEARVLAITAGSITLRVQEQEVTLEVAAPQEGALNRGPGR